MRLRALNRRQGLLALALAALAAAAGCSGLGFYGQSVRGGLEVLWKRESIERRLADPATPPEVRRGLETALSARTFATRELALPDNGSYRSYSDLGRPAALWNVVAAPELGVEPVEWCFPFAGCVTYRGYFSRHRAERFAARLRRRGFDADVAPVTAYSTLGFFADPVLNTFVELPAPRLAGLLFHELAHQRLYVAGDTAFNESFATVVELEGVRRWLERHGSAEQEASYRRSKELARRFVELALGARERLEEVYAAERGEAWKRWHKRRVLGELRHDFRRLRREDGAWEAYAGWFSGGVDNADLAALGAYHRYEPGFERLLDECGRDLRCFYAAAEALAERPEEEREARLAAPSPDVPARAENASVKTTGGLELTHLANEGYLLAGGGRKALIDAFVAEPYSVYPAVPPAVFDDMVEGRGVFARIDLALASHVHRDHFQPGAAARFLRAHPETVFVSSPQVVDALLAEAPDLAPRAESGAIRRVLPADGESVELEVAGIRVEVLRLRHGSERFHHLHNLGHVVELGGRSVLHVGDVEMAAERFLPYRLSERALDAALIPVWFFFHQPGPELVAEHLAARLRVATHLSREQAAEAEALARELRERGFGDVRVAAEPLARIDL